MESKTITKSDLIAAVSDCSGLSTTEAARIVKDVFASISDSLISGNKVSISSLGVFRLLDKNARMGRNPKTKEAAAISARRVVAFHPSALLRQTLNK